MRETTSKRKVCILGGGLGGLSTAYFLTNDPNWRDTYESITLHQLGWRLGGKCASSRNQDACHRIEEHGIHLFGGFYFNAFEMMKGVYGALDRPPGTPLADIEKAFHPNNSVTMWETVNAARLKWQVTQGNNGKLPWNHTGTLTPGALLAGAFRGLMGRVFSEIENVEHGVLNFFGFGHNLKDRAAEHADRIVAKFEAAHEPDDLVPVLDDLDGFLHWVEQHLKHMVMHKTAWRRVYVALDFMLALFSGFIRDDVWQRGFDALDNEDYVDWLKRHGASDLTLASPMPLAVPNVLFAYREGDTSRAPTMAAGGFLHWTFLSFNDWGAYAWLFAAGTGETLIAPIYQVLEARGVQFEFFNKVEELKLGPGQKTVDTVEIGLQATLAQGVTAYDPLAHDPKNGLVGWPSAPHYEQLAQGAALRKAGVNLESWWADWPPVAHKTLTRGRDYDDLVIALSIGAFPYVCDDLIKANPDWQAMVDNVPAIQTQAFQIWLDKAFCDIAEDVPTGTYDITTGFNYADPTSCFADMSHLIKYEGWPADNCPKTVLYFCGPMAEDPVPPAFDDHAYPDHQAARVKWQAAQYLQSVASPFMPGATVAYDDGAPGSRSGFDFGRLICPDKVPSDAPLFNRLNQQFFRANIDPTERYVTSPPGSTAFRLEPGASGFDHVFLAGDWTRNGLNVGCVEATVMSAKLAATALGNEKHTVYGFNLNAHG